MRQVLYLIILTLLRNAAGLTSPALYVKEGASMRRIIMLVTVALVMAAMTVATAGAASAQGPQFIPTDCVNGRTGEIVPSTGIITPIIGETRCVPTQGPQSR